MTARPEEAARAAAGARPAAEPGSTDGALTHRQILTVLAGLTLGSFLAALDQTIVSTSIRTIGDDLHGLSAQAWVTTAFLITSTLTTPIYGKLSDLYGRKQLFLLAIVIFTAGSVLCGLSTSMYMLAAFRAFQGLGAGGLGSIALAILADIVSPQQRPRYVGYLLSSFIGASVLGPVIGGLLSGQSTILGITGWRWIFYVNVPLAILALVVVNRVLRFPEQRQTNVRIDWPGALVMAIGLVPLLIVAEQGRVWGWASPGSLGCYLAGAVGLALFFVVELRMGEAALLPARLFHIQAFRLGSIQSLVGGVTMYGGLAAMPLYLQIVKGASPMKAGFLLLPMVCAMMATGITVGRLSARSGRYRRYPITGTALLFFAFLALASIGADTPLWQTDFYMAAFGIGLGLSTQTIQLALQNSVGPSDIGVASSSGTFFRQLGGTLGAAIFLSILFSSAPGKIDSAIASAQSQPAFHQAATAHPDQLAALHQGATSLNDTSFLSSIESVLAHPFLIGFSNAMDLVFIVGAGVAVITFILALMIKEVPLRRMSGLQARQLAAQAAAAEALGPEAADNA